MHVKKGDKVKVIAGGDKGKVSEIVEARARCTRRRPISRARRAVRRAARTCAVARGCFCAHTRG